MFKLSMMDVSQPWLRHQAIPREVMTMGKFCEVCEKGQMIGHNVSHSNRKSSRTWAPNVQQLRVIVEGTPVRLNVCTRCIRTLRKNGALQAMVSAETEAAAE